MLSSRQRLQGNKLDELGYLSRGIEQKPRNLDRKLVSRRCQDVIVEAPTNH